jgi:uncharacterized protein YndB with AHSA1/START domain
MTTAENRGATLTLPADDQILIVRELDAPPALVFEAWTTPELVASWWHAGRGEITSIEIDLRVGGRWRYAMLAHGSFEVAFHGEYREIVTGGRLVSTEIFEGAPDAAAVMTTTFEDLGGRTRLTLLVHHNSIENRDLHLKAGMEEGLNDALVLLEVVARSRASAA